MLGTTLNLVLNFLIQTSSLAAIGSNNDYNPVVESTLIFFFVTLPTDYVTIQCEQLACLRFGVISIRLKLASYRKILISISQEGIINASDAGASINTPNIGNSALIIEELDWGGQDALNTCENSFFGPHLGLGRQKT